MDAQLVSHVKDLLAGNGRDRKQKWSFTLECGRGETYAHRRPVLYGHSTYPRGSLLAGRDQRVFLEEWNTWDEGRAAVKEMAKVIPALKRVADLGPTATEPASGSTHVPLAVMTAGLPDDADY